MPDKKYGGPASPDGGQHDYTGGMTLRDYFAAKALQAIIIGNCADECAMGIGAARDAYAVADAMLAAREEKA